MNIVLSRVSSNAHALPGHPESPQRFRAFESLLTGAFASTLELVEAIADEQERHAAIQRVHEDTYTGMIRDAMARAPLFLDYGDTYATPQSYESAMAAVGGTLAVTQAIQQGDSIQGFALVRPPGHHANQNQAGGFCLFNNIAVAASTMQNHGYAKVTIVDFDVHHGNGTQDIFYEDPSVLFISTHQWGIYPGSGHKHEIGQDPAEGTTLNVPLPAYSGDRAFASIYERIIQPALDRFKPDFMLVSAGFDAHWSDPLANLQLSTTGYHALAQKLALSAEQHCSGKIAFVLEGGYDPEALADNVGAVLYALAGQDLPDDRLGPAPIDEPNVDGLLEELRSIHSL
jgi:acetoin utilization deacetylase AcuC-like enzyme